MYSMLHTKFAGLVASEEKSFEVVSGGGGGAGLWKPCLSYKLALGAAGSGALKMIFIHL